MTVKKALYVNFVGKPGFARAAHTLWFYAVSRFEELHKTGKLAENRRFFDKLKRHQSDAVYFFHIEYIRYAEMTSWLCSLS